MPLFTITHTAARGLVSCLLAAAASTSPSAVATAQGGRGGPPAQGSTGALTRSASKYFDLETRLLGALQDRHAADSSALLASDFEVWSAERADATTRDAFIAAGLPAGIRSFRVRGITVRELGDQAIVSFLLELREPTGTTRSTAFVVDVWSVRTNQLTVRYVSQPAKPAVADARRF